MRCFIPAFILLATSAAAQESSEAPKCFEAPKVAEFLSRQFGEKPFAEMDDRNGRHLFIFVSPTTNSWTVAALVGGSLCAVDAGEKFQPADASKFAPKT